MTVHIHYCVGFRGIFNGNALAVSSAGFFVATISAGIMTKSSTTVKGIILSHHEQVQT